VNTASPPVCDVLVVGGGAAGIACAIELASAGMKAELCEQTPRLGGAVHRQPLIEGGTAITSPALRRRWRRLSSAFARTGIMPRLGHVFLGVDAAGLSLLEDRASGRVVSLRARAVIIATGAIERVRPRPGWHLPGVATAGGMQVMLKETGTPPAGRVLVAGNGPLTLALAAQLARLGNPPVAVVEAGDPLARWPAAWRMALRPGLLAEACHHLATLKMAGVPWLRGAEVTAVRRDGRALVATVDHRDGAVREIAADHIALHDGIRGIDMAGLSGGPQAAMPLVLGAGDCREVLGAVGAEVDGRSAARQAIARLTSRDMAAGAIGGALDRERAAQALLADLFRPVSPVDRLAALPDETILCRCEKMTVGDLRRLASADASLSPREIKLNGRFGMGACQGRFCAEWTMRLASAHAGQTAAAASELTGSRWPLRPVSVGSIVAGD
jgi:thioredoxin reductase